MSGTVHSKLEALWSTKRTLMPIYSATQLYVTHNKTKLSVIFATLDNLM